MTNNTKIHKQNSRLDLPKVSIILLDWSCRERFHTLDWLAKQDVSRDQYELIWVELYNRVIPEAMEKADVVVTCNQTGIYHKHIGYNIGLLLAKGAVITVCDSDAVFPPDFVSSIITAFNMEEVSTPDALVLMHYEWRSDHIYPDKIFDISELSKYKWADLWPNVGACVSFRKLDAIRFGGFDEHPSFLGYMCGPYDLGWRLINAGITETWYDKSVALWHFAHPNPLATSGQKFLWKQWREIKYPHIEGHALTAVEAFSAGRVTPLKENPEIFQLRMSLRQIGSTYEKKYAFMSDIAKPSLWLQGKLRLVLMLELAKTIVKNFIKRFFKSFLGAQIYEQLLIRWRSPNVKKSS